MNAQELWTRRALIARSAAAGGALVLASCGPAGRALAAATAPATQDAGDITPAEDLMFEHGVIERLVLIYEEARERLDSAKGKEDAGKGKEDPTAEVAQAANIVRKFAEDYHEKNEENFVFPRLTKASRHVELVRTLKAQHEAGRKLTDLILKLSEGASPAADPKRLSAALRLFSRMYIPHISRENSVVFRAFRQLVPAKEYDELGDRFEEQEHKLFGSDGFEKFLEQVARIEKRLGIGELTHYTPEE